MQISTSRVNFTNSSVAHFNYVKFLGQHRSAEKGVQDIVTILGLHTDEITINTGLVSAARRFRSASRRSRKRDWVLVALNTLRFKIERSSQWCRSVIITMKSERQRVKVECDLAIGVMTMEYEITSSYVISIENRILQKVLSGRSKCFTYLLTILRNILIECCVRPNRSYGYVVGTVLTVQVYSIEFRRIRACFTGF